MNKRQDGDEGQVTPVSETGTSSSNITDLATSATPPPEDGDVPEGGGENRTTGEDSNSGNPPNSSMSAKMPHFLPELQLTRSRHGRDRNECNRRDRVNRDNFSNWESSASLTVRRRGCRRWNRVGHRRRTHRFGLRSRLLLLEATQKRTKEHDERL